MGTALLTFRSRITDSLPLELGELTPSRIADKSIPQIERLAVLHGNRTLVLADFFDISGSPADGKLRFIGEMNSVHRLGERMDQGAIHVEGSIGRHLGAGMTGGEITVEGDAGDFAGCEMAGGTIRILGDAGNALALLMPEARAACAAARFSFTAALGTRR